ncbi:DUF4199 domain-containing protein [Sphingomonadaceae bacterium G21617-S1]|jgi:hypothetical protein|uniref:DUF4199 domain-containing protein n=1 Tax=Rhizorhabdus sp. TaxID=1968843 RepID=UPI0019A7A492|nr:DUF4199 domain-containing protein [Rhizorhabdus sp.]MBD3760534.1 DUF4199 domain-containing protein [Rhizorhabdus sp.]MCZ4341794.1 DUF4199 domain-containing protein [Sphingomonadaceae bacterium G21617-S1]
MLRTVLTYGIVAGLIVGIPSFAITVLFADRPPLPYGMALGYLIMLIALSTVFVAVKRRRDDQLGGVIRFWPGFGLGLAISLIASLFYIAAWELALSITGTGFLANYTEAMVADAAKRGAGAAELAGIRAEMDAFWVSYRNPLVRIPYSFIEIFPVGLLVSLVSAGLLRNPRFLPARTG